MDKKVIKRLKKLLIGNECKKIIFEGIPYLTIEKKSLNILALWRISDSNRILLASSEVFTLEGLKKLDQNKYKALLVGKKIRNVSVSGRFHDLCLEFENDIIFEIFSNSSVYENWQLAGGDREMIIAGPGVLWSTFALGVTTK